MCVNISKKALAVIVVGIIAGSIAVAYAGYTLWQGTIQWTMEETAFSVWDSSSGGIEHTSPYAVDKGFWSTGEHTVTFYLENEGNVPITISVTSETPYGCMATWSNEGTWDLPVTTARTSVTLTLDISETGSYVWEFESVATS